MVLLPTALDAPPYWFNEYRRSFESKGWVVLAWGSNAVILEHPDRAGVLRLSTDYKSFLLFCELAIKTESEFCPRIYKQLTMSGILYTWMEKLESVDTMDEELNHFWITSDYIVRVAQGIREGRPIECDFNPPLQELTQLGMALGREAARVNGILDFKHSNFMCRPADKEKVPVLMDVLRLEEGAENASVMYN